MTDHYLDGIPKDSRAGREEIVCLREDKVEDIIDKTCKINEIAKNRG